METKILPAPWYGAGPTDELLEACDLFGDAVWREAAIDYYAIRQARMDSGQNPAKGMQAQINRTIEQRFIQHGWIASEGRMVKNSTWVRVTFRHQMSLGSDFLEAAKMCRKEGCLQAAIFAGETDWLQIVSPRDYRAMVSFEKLKIACFDLERVLDIPLYIGGLSGKS